MVYAITHKRRVLGKQIHETLEKKKARFLQKSRALDHKLYRPDSRVNNYSAIVLEEVEKGKVESKYLVPEVKNWVETEPVKLLKEKVKTWLNLNYPVHIIGPTGCGKTYLALQAAKELNRPVVWVNGDESVTTTDLIGGYSQVEVESIRDKYIHNVFKDKDILKAEWLDNPLTIACKYGYTFVYNEFSRSKAVANNVLLSIFSEGILELPTKFGEERYVKVHPAFRAIFVSNSIEYAGVHKPQDALLDRMAGIFMDYYDRETEAKIISAHTKIDEKQALAIVDTLRSIREKFPEECRLGTRAGVMIGQALSSNNNFDKVTVKQLLLDTLTSKAKNLKQFKEYVKVVEKF